MLLSSATHPWLSFPLFAPYVSRVVALYIHGQDRPFRFICFGVSATLWQSARVEKITLYG